MPQQPQQLRFQIIPEVFRVGEALHKAGGRPVLVGGWVRDALLGIPHRRDFDIEVFGLAMGRLRTTLARIGPVHAVGRHFGVLKLTTREAEYDISVPRRESNIGKGHRGFLVEPDPHMSFDEAAARRDFTINAMGYAFLDDALLDPFGGERDLREGILRHVGPAFGEDPLRVLRAMQFAGRFDLRIVPQTLELCRSLDLGELPRERIWEELKKLLLHAPRPSHGFGYAQGLGVLAYFPELRRLHDAGGNLATEGRTPWTLTQAMLDRAAALRVAESWQDLVMMTAALCHRMEEAIPEGACGTGTAVAAFLSRLTNESAFIAAVQTLIAELPTPQRLYEGRDRGAPGTIRRMALRISIPSLLRPASAYHQSLHGEAPFEAGVWLEARARALNVWDQAPEPILKGRHLLKRGMQSGPAMGQLIQMAFEAQLDGDINSLEEAHAWLDAQRARESAVNPDGVADARGSATRRGKS